MKLSISQYVVLVDTLQRSLTFENWPGYSNAKRQEVLDVFLSDKLLVSFDLPDYHDALSERQVAIVEGIVSGRSRKEMAEALFVSYSTLKREIARILDIYGAVTLEEAIGQITKRYGKGTE